jgi:hypothetical protein
VPSARSCRQTRHRSSPASRQTLWIGPGHHLVHYPISAGEFVNLVAFAPAGDYTVESWTATATVGEFLAEFAGWDQRLVDLIRAAGTPGRWALLDRAPLSRWSEGAATLLGDAAHPIRPRPRSSPGTPAAHRRAPRPGRRRTSPKSTTQGAAGGRGAVRGARVPRSRRRGGGSRRFCRDRRHRKFPVQPATPGNGRTLRDLRGRRG